MVGVPTALRPDEADIARRYQFFVGSVLVWVLPLIWLWILAPAAEASQRVALVIGNGAYTHAPLMLRRETHWR